MERAPDRATEADACVIWQAKPTARAVVGELLVSLVLFGLYVAASYFIPARDPWSAWVGFVFPAISIIRSIITTLRGRVVLNPDGIEVRRVFTRHYPWSSLLSLTLEEEGVIEITPKGWVRHLPIPRSEGAAAFAVISDWRARAAQPEVADTGAA